MSNLIIFEVKKGLSGNEESFIGVKKVWIRSDEKFTRQRQ
jgi:hypothetical protein